MRVRVVVPSGARDDAFTVFFEGFLAPSWVDVYAKDEISAYQKGEEILKVRRKMFLVLACCLSLVVASIIIGAAWKRPSKTVEVEKVTLATKPETYRTLYNTCMGGWGVSDVDKPGVSGTPMRQKRIAMCHAQAMEVLR